MQIPFRILLALIILSGTAFADCGMELPRDEVLRPDTPGLHGHHAIYRPAEPPPLHGYPVFLWYHGFGGAPNVRIPGAITGGEIFLLVGLDYGSREFHDTLHPDLLDEEVQRVRSLLDTIEQCVEIDRNAIVLGGFSQGGYATSLIGELMLGEISGMMILAAGRTRGPMGFPEDRLLRDFPIFIGVGAKDRVHGERAETTANLYAQHGASVSFEKWPRMDHGDSWRWYQNTKISDRTLAPRRWLNHILERADASRRK